MATVEQYMAALKNRRQQIALKSGVDITQTDKTTRVMARTQDAMLAVFIKGVVDKGTISNAELDAIYDAAAAAAYDNEPVDPPA